jgi:hypothetical protein
MAFSGRGLTAIAAIIIMRALRGIFIRGCSPVPAQLQILPKEADQVPAALRHRSTDA